MISQISQINPYVLIPLTINLPIPHITKNAYSQKNITVAQLDKESARHLLNLICISRDGIYGKALKNFISISGVNVSDIDRVLNDMLKRDKVVAVKEKYLIADKKHRGELYGRLGSKWKANYHNFYGHALVETFRGKKSITPEIADNFWKAGNRHKSKEYLEKAGDYQKETYKNNEAIKSYKRCISLLSDDEKPRRLDVMIKILEIMYTTGKWDEFNKMYPEAEGISKTLGARESRAKVLNLSGSVSFFRGEVGKAIKTFRKAETLMLDNTISYTYAETMRFLGRSFLQMGKNDKAEEFFNKTLKAGEKLRNDELRAKALENIGRVYRLKSEYEKAIGYYRQALPLYKKVGNSKGVSDTLEKLGVAHFYMGNNSEALKIFKSANRVNVSINNMVGICNNLGNIGTVYLNKKYFLKAEHYYLKQLEVARFLKNIKVQLTAIGNMGLIKESRCDYKRALLYYDKQWKVYKRLNDWIGISNSLSNKGNMLCNLGKFKEGKNVFGNQILLDSKRKNFEGVARGYNNLGFIYFRERDYASAFKSFKKAVLISKKYKLNKIYVDAHDNFIECKDYLKNYNLNNFQK